MHATRGLRIPPRPIALLAVSLGVLGCALPSRAAARPGADAVRGTYRVQGKAHVSARPVLDRDVDAHADVRLEPGTRPGELRARIAAEGSACTLVATLATDGALSFASGQRCPVDVRSDEARGHVDARLVSGRGRLRDDRLSLDLAWDLSGDLSLRTGGGGAQLLGVELPAAWTPDAPVRGSAQASVEGFKDESRGAR